MSLIKQAYKKIEQMVKEADENESTFNPKVKVANLMLSEEEILEASKFEDKKLDVRLQIHSRIFGSDANVNGVIDGNRKAERIDVNQTSENVDASDKQISGLLEDKINDISRIPKNSQLSPHSVEFKPSNSFGKKIRSSDILMRDRAKASILDNNKIK